LIGQINPLMRGDFKLPFVLIRTLDRSDIPVVRRHPVAGGQWKGGLQVGFLRLPINGVGKLDAIAGVPC